MVYIEALRGNLDERVTDRVLYDILIQAGRIVDLHIPRDKETNKPKGYAFAEYETEEIADYAVRLFSGLVIIYNRTLKFAISGRDRPSQNLPTTSTPALNSSHKPRPHPVTVENMENSHSSRLSRPYRVSAVNYSQVSVPAGVTHQSNGYGSNFNATNYNYSQRVFGATLDSISHTSSDRYNINSPIAYPSY
ncbi:RNA recognition motif-containing protein [Tripterygium wilfordii]|uniref:RNA recognition motif-containing protein n=1 Tax=Tripterygium wilfordii TaxID=458696 RepID=A0A7J7CXJ3_TRIWF|nr:RNA-binding protein 7-like isoform X2 [Tripterygium wilfordii]KAF5738827.1 RNA recognition motif-containing protein [Tripterygium wilfordii]